MTIQTYMPPYAEAGPWYEVYDEIGTLLGMSWIPWDDPLKPTWEQYEGKAIRAIYIGPPRKNRQVAVPVGADLDSLPNFFPSMQARP